MNTQDANSNGERRAFPSDRVFATRGFSFRAELGMYEPRGALYHTSAKQAQVVITVEPLPNDDDDVSKVIFGSENYMLPRSERVKHLRVIINPDTDNLDRLLDKDERERSL